MMGHSGTKEGEPLLSSWHSLTDKGLRDEGKKKEKESDRVEGEKGKKSRMLGNQPSGSRCVITADIESNWQCAPARSLN